MMLESHPASSKTPVSFWCQLAEPRQRSSIDEPVWDLPATPEPRLASPDWSMQASPARSSLLLSFLDVDRSRSVSINTTWIRNNNVSISLVWTRVIRSFRNELDTRRSSLLHEWFFTDLYMVPHECKIRSLFEAFANDQFRKRTRMRHIDHTRDSCSTFDSSRESMIADQQLWIASSQAELSVWTEFDRSASTALIFRFAFG